MSQLYFCIHFELSHIEKSYYTICIERVLLDPSSATWWMIWYVLCRAQNSLIFTAKLICHYMWGELCLFCTQSVAMLGKLVNAAQWNMTAPLQFSGDDLRCPTEYRGSAVGGCLLPGTVTDVHSLILGVYTAFSASWQMLYRSICIEKYCTYYVKFSHLSVRHSPLPDPHLTEMECVQCIICLHVFDILLRLFLYVLTRENVFSYWDRHFAFLCNFVTW